LVTAAMSRAINPHSCGNFSWYHEGETQRLPCSDYDRAADVANMLWRENIKSVAYRYPGDKTSATLPGPTGEDFAITAADFPAFSHLEPVQVLCSLACYEYQTCEHPEWEASESHTFCEALRHAAISALPGYDKAEWGAPKKFRIARMVAA
jgi:hypothetical protein